MVVATDKRSKVASVSKSSVEQATAFLQALPDKPKETFSLREAVNRLRESIQATLAKGYSYEEVARVLSDQGVSISPSTLKNYVPSGKRQPATAGASEVKPRGKQTRSTQTDAAIATEGVETPVDASAVATNDLPVEAEVTIAPAVEAPAAPTEVSPAPAKRGRGRKQAAPAEVQPASEETTAPKRGRGRPKSNSAANENASAPASSESVPQTAPTRSPRSRTARTTKAASAAKKATPATSTTRVTRGRKQHGS